MRHKFASGVMDEETIGGVCSDCGDGYEVVFRRWVRNGKFYENCVIRLCCEKTLQQAKRVVANRQQKDRYNENNPELLPDVE